MPTRFIELAGQINVSMPTHVIRRLGDTLDARFSMGLNGAKILVIGAAYKPNVDDLRESPALKIISLLKQKGAKVDYHDPYISTIHRTRDYPDLAGMVSVPWNDITPDRFDAVLICTDHKCLDYADLVDRSRLVIDTRNATAQVTSHRDRIVKA